MGMRLGGQELNSGLWECGYFTPRGVLAACVCRTEFQNDPVRGKLSA